MGLEQIKNIYQTLREYFTTIENDFGKISDFGPYPYASIFGGEVCKFAYYIAASDGKLDDRERIFINRITGYGESREAMIHMMEQTGVVFEKDREQYAKTPFKCILIALVADIRYKELGKSNDYFRMLLTFFVLLGTDLIAIDRQVTKEEEEALQAIVDTMQIVAESMQQEKKYILG